MIHTRHASPQAWGRIRRAIGPGEARDIAADIARAVVDELELPPGSIAGPGPVMPGEDVDNLAESIRHALESVPWDRYTQA